MIDTAVAAFEKAAAIMGQSWVILLGAGAGLALIGAVGLLILRLTEG